MTGCAGIADGFALPANISPATTLQKMYQY